jgi:hypothetical protein
MERRSCDDSACDTRRSFSQRLNAPVARRGSAVTHSRDDLADLDRAFQDAEAALRRLVEADHVIDAVYMDRYRTAAAAEERTRTARHARYRELLD